MKYFITFYLLLSITSLSAQYAQVYPTHWWPGMKWNKVQLLIRGAADISADQVSIRYPGITINKIQPLENTKYLAVDITIAPSAKPGNVNIHFNHKGNRETVSWQLKPRRKGLGKTYAQGIYSNDFIYFLMPDRFSNGDPSNDRIAGLLDQSLNRDSIFYRHGGDLQGVMNHLDYLQALGVTTLWLTPVLENNMPDRTEHGYAITNHYKVEPRFGGDTAYKRLSDELHKRGMKLIQDAV
jgi:hypothetical protein